ncbi:uncharacterized protein tp53i13 [Cololabis saira]|uniref:uncharacterized protein tp53i13 n=1 Tax=Cololabis saira TaxID=129043 RepID=UPI002AD322AE|nr:uncharacterized protein tp53i13 [Cololabis saira]
MSGRVAVTLLAALWLSSAGRAAPQSPADRCDDGKLNVDADLPAEAVYGQCAVPARPESTQRLPSIDTVHDPEPAVKICMNKPISYNHAIPNSGAFRPVRAESGEYLYCPPQRWLNNLHLGAAVLLHHPCAPLQERLLLSAVARSCLPDYIITPHPQLDIRLPVALVSWGRTLQLTTAASAEICAWLQATQARGNAFAGTTQTRKYNLLLIRSAGLHPLEPSMETEGSLRRCCEETLSSLLGGSREAEAGMKKKPSIRIKEEMKSREIRAALRQTENNKTRGSMTDISNVVWSDKTNGTILQRTADVQQDNSTLGASVVSLSGKTLTDPSVLKQAPQSEVQDKDHAFTLRPATHSVSVPSKSDSSSSGSGAFQSQKSRAMQPTAAVQAAARADADLTPQNASAATQAFSDGWNREQNRTAGPDAPDVRSKHRGAWSVKRKDENPAKKKVKGENVAEGNMKADEVIDLKERELEHNIKHGQHQAENRGVDSASKSQADPQPDIHSQANANECGSCDAGQRCDCSSAAGAELRAVSPGLPRTPRTDEAVWAAAALGFLLVLLTLSILHTRLYRHWRTTPSLYWHDPRQDYDSVADVIRRRLRIANRRRKRGRRQECVLLPSSSSSEEDP